MESEEVMSPWAAGWLQREEGEEGEQDFGPVCCFIPARVIHSWAVWAVAWEHFSQSLVEEVQFDASSTALNWGPVHRLNWTDMCAGSSPPSVVYAGRMNK